MTTEAERIFARRVTAGMFRAAYDQLAPAWKLCPVWGTWTPTDERAAEQDRRFRAMPLGQLVSEMERLAKETRR